MQSDALIGRLLGGSCASVVGVVPNTSPKDDAVGVLTSAWMRTLFDPIPAMFAA